jgi:protein-S-isoprenylcysteine O-methyltransferase Ste14
MKILVFTIFTAIAAITTIHSIRVKETYGYHRFIAFEVLAVLIVLNMDQWFREPFSIKQIISWLIFLVSTILAIHGIYLLRTAGKSQSRGIEETLAVVYSGAYKYIRHPLYASLIMFSWGVFLKGADIISGLLTITTTIFMITTARYEEKYNTDQFGDEYIRYMERTKMFIPFIY